MTKKELENENLEETSEETTEEETNEEDETVKSVLRSIDSKIKSSIEAHKAEMDADLKKWKEKNSRPVAKKTVDALLADEKFASVIKGFKSNGGRNSVSIDLDGFDFRAKASVAGDISIADNYSGTVALSELESGVSRDAQRQPFIEDMVTVGTISAPIDTWIETVDENGEPVSLAELQKYPQTSYDFAEASAPVRKIGHYAKYSYEMAEDLPNLVSEIRNFLVADLRRKVDSELLVGDGSGERITGILENAEAYDAGAFAGTVIDANHFDVIETAVSQVISAHYTPNYVVVHPTDLSKMNLAKGNDGHYVLPPFIAEGGNRVSGVRVVANTGITEGDFLVGDFTRSSVKYRKGLTVDISNTDEDDFTRDRFTVKASVRLVQRVKGNDYPAFVKGNFATAIGLLEAGS